MEETKVTVVTVVYGARWHLLKQVADSVLRDEKVKTFIIVDNGCTNPVEMDAYAKDRGDRIVILRQGKNIGYSGAISKGLEYARATDGDYVFVLDDDSVPEENAIDHFLETLKLFPDNKVVLAGNRVDVPGMEQIFRRAPLKNAIPRGTLFEVFSIRKAIHLFRLLRGVPRSEHYPFTPIVPIEAFVTGASFIPMQAVREAPLPDESLFLYGEDLEYSWRIKRMGYAAYVCARPIIRDIDMTFPGEEGAHIFGLFDAKTPDYRVYFRLRNAVIISRRNTTQAHPVLFLNVIVWTIGLLFLGLWKKGISKLYFERARLVLQAIHDGYQKEKPKIPATVKIPGA